MSCQEFWDKMPELDLESDGALDHARECATCSALLEQQRALRGGLRAVARDWHWVEAPPRLERKLVSAFQSHNGLRRSRPSYHWMPAVVWTAATAAVVLLATVLLHPHQPQPHPAQRKAPHRIEYAAFDPAGANDIAGNSLDPDFVPLPDAAQIEPADDVNLVRVELPRSAMAALGYVVGPDRAADPVEAEVMIGPDGLARAVRFLGD